MTDIAIRSVSAPGEPPRFDVALDGHDLARDDGLRTAVLRSLFTDRRAADDDAGDDGEMRGWWADPDFGSRLWLLLREKETAGVLIRAKAYADEALLWFVDEGIVRSVAVAASWVRRGVLGITIDMVRLDGSRYTELFDFSLGG